MVDADRDYTIQALHHALAVPEAFLEPDKGGQVTSEIGEALGLNRNRVFRILSTLE